MFHISILWDQPPFINVAAAVVFVSDRNVRVFAMLSQERVCSTRSRQTKALCCDLTWHDFR